MNVHLNGSAYVTHAAWPIMYEKNFGRIVLTSSTSGIYGNFGQANYGAAKMGMLGLINVLAIEGASKNIRVNGLAPSAATRLIATIPGREDLDPENPDADVHPKLVTPAVLLMAGENAPNGKIIQAGGGRFSTCAVFNNADLELWIDAEYEDLLAIRAIGHEPCAGGLESTASQLNSTTSQKNRANPAFKSTVKSPAASRSDLHVMGSFVVSSTRARLRYNPASNSSVMPMPP